MKPLRIAAVLPFLPWPPDHGGRIRAAHLLRGLARRHRVTALGVIADPAEERAAAPLRADGIELRAVLRPRRFGALGGADRARKLLNLALGRSDLEARFRSGAVDAAVRALGGPFDVALAETLWGAAAALAVPARVHALDAHNVESVVAERAAARERGGLARALARREAANLRRREAALVRRFGLVVAVSGEDAAGLRALAPGARVEVVSNAVDTEALDPLPPAGPPETILFAGSCNYPPNEEAALWLLREIVPPLRAKLPRLVVLLLGADPSRRVLDAAAATGGVEAPGWVPDLRPWYARAHVAVAPLRVGGGTRTKILEAMALGRAVVATRLGAEGLPFRDGAELMLADEPRAFADAVAALVAQPARRAELERRARAAVEREFSAARAAQRFEELLVAAVGAA